MHHFPCTPDCPLEIWADWLEDHDIDPGEIRLLASGWISPGTGYDAGYDTGYGTVYGYGYDTGYGNGYIFGYY